MGVKIRGQNPWLCKVKPTLTALRDLYATKVSAFLNERSRSKWTYSENPYTPTISTRYKLCMCINESSYVLSKKLKKLNIIFPG